MINNLVLSRPEFLILSLESKWYYYHMCAFADDDGIYVAFDDINTGKISKQAYNELINSPFVAEIYNKFNIVYITDWQKHNYIRPDRKKTSEYIDYLNEWRDKNTENATKNFTQNSCPQIDRIDLDQDLDLDIDQGSDQDLERSEPERKKYGINKNVLLTKDEYEEYKRINPDSYLEYINDLSRVIKKKKNHYINHFAVLKSWQLPDYIKASDKPPDGFMDTDNYENKGWDSG